MRASTIYSFLLAAALSGLTACNPKIYSFTVNPLSTGQNDSVRVSWKAKGDVFLLIRDANHPGSGTARLHDLNLLVTMDGKTARYTLHTDSTVRLHLPGEDSLVVRKEPDSFSEDILRTLILVASLHGKEADSVTQVEVRIDSAKDEIAFRPKKSGDSLLAEGTNNPARWGDNFGILTVATGSSRTLAVTHSNITRVLNPDDPPDEGFKGTPVKGDWSFQTLMTPGEKNGSQRLPVFLKITITIKHN
jgi:hypothetical protein